MTKSSPQLERVIAELSRLPGIGRRSASRIAFHLIAEKEQNVESLLNSIRSMKETIGFCRECGGISEEEICSICRDDTRNRHLICVVETPREVISIETAADYTGLYHVLDGVVSPLDGIGPDDLRMDSLVERVEKEKVEEIILALNPSVEGDATGLYIRRIIPESVRITRIARGLPVGADLEYTDAATLSRSIEARTDL